jgi:hypothetical protein
MKLHTNTTLYVGAAEPDTPTALPSETPTSPEDVLVPSVDWRRQDLLDYAADRHILVPSGATKAEILVAIQRGA